MSLFHILLFLVITSTYAFLPKINIQVQQLVSSKAILSGIVSSVTEEFWSDNFIFRELALNHKYSNFDILYTVLLFATILNKPILQNSFYKWNAVGRFSIIEKKTKLILFVVMIIFNRNIENAI
jgi:hypothetical protein